MKKHLPIVDESVSLRLWIFALLAFCISIGCFIAEHFLEEAHKVFGSIFREIGSALLVSVVLGLFWDAFVKRAYTDELLSKTGISRSIAVSGLSLVTTFRSGEIDWRTFFNGNQNLDIFVAYGSTWRNTHVEQLNEMLQNKGAALRVILPDPDNQRVTDELAKRFETNAEEISKKIREAADFFLERKNRAQGSVQVTFTEQTPLYSFYIFTSGAVFALYNHRSGREEPVPSFLCDSQGTFYKYLQREFAGLRENATAK